MSVETATDIGLVVIASVLALGVTWLICVITFSF